MTWIELIAAALALGAAVVLLATPTLRQRRLRARSPARILFPVLGSRVSRSTLDAALRLAQSDSATLVPAYIATVPMTLNLEAPIPKECETAMPLLEAIERRAIRLEVPVDSRIERGRTPRHALAELIEHERFDRIVVPAQTSRSDGFPPDDIAWLLEHAPGEVVVLRPDADARGEPTQQASVS
jgi:nucleotide-binding universal stress UspA family protein